MLVTTSRNKIVHTPDLKIARFAFSPVISGNTNVPPNIATMCWAPTPMVSNQDSLSAGRVIAPTRRALTGVDQFQPGAVVACSLRQMSAHGWAKAHGGFVKPGTNALGLPAAATPR